MRPADTPAIVAEKLLYLTELVAAIDRRLPQAQRAGESAIANAAVRLRLEAVKRIDELKRESGGRPHGQPTTPV